MHEATSRRLRAPPKELLADTGYADLGDIKRIQTDTPTRCYIPENDAPVANRDVQFTYAPEADQYRCSAGRTLAPIAKGRYRSDRDAYMDIYRGTDCAGCLLAAEPALPSAKVLWRECLGPCATGWARFRSNCWAYGRCRPRLTSTPQDTT